MLDTAANATSAKSISTNTTLKQLCVLFVRMCHFSQLRTYETLNTYKNRPTDKCVCNSPTATMESLVLSTARERKSKAGAQWSLTLSAETPAPSDTVVGVHGFPKATSQPPTNAYDIGRCTREQQQKKVENSLYRERLSQPLSACGI